VEKHGDEAMGFPPDNTTHHFRLYSDGSAIEVTVNDNTDSQNLLAIRSHLTHIVTMFSNGEFSIPMFVHDQVPPGVPVMEEKQAEISYTFEELPAGGRVRIKTANRDALHILPIGFSFPKTSADAFRLAGGVELAWRRRKPTGCAKFLRMHRRPVWPFVPVLS
jgi:hypothetical protein